MTYLAVLFIVYEKQWPEFKEHKLSLMLAWLTLKTGKMQPNPNVKPVFIEIESDLSITAFKNILLICKTQQT